ncbi:hypothetical protein [Neobacillus mesonae]|uniref:hypothetical protein n=1 Tax=Neobacillus mesonae TaxID=1193713 RepID=UPI00203FA6B8|nr:hypothetical protein [Neobacillus mesonae]MCM3568621.1 hypothetical protein [Neobacillus mesonae]
MVERSMKKGWIARGGGKNGGTVNGEGWIARGGGKHGGTVNGEELDGPRRRKK